MNKTLCELLDERQPGLGSTYQNGVEPGPQKVAQFREALTLMKVPALYSGDGDVDPMVLVKLFDPAGAWTWYITEWDGDRTAFGLICGDFPELGYMDIVEMANVRGRLGIGIELDMHFTPLPLSSLTRPRFSAA